ILTPPAQYDVVRFLATGFLKPRVKFRRVVPFVVRDASVFDHDQAVPFAGLYAQFDVRDKAIGFPVSSYFVAVQAHFIVTILQTLKITKHSPQTLLASEP